jgi:putative membrane protein
MTLDERTLRLVVLGSWSAFLLWLWLSGEVVRYLGPRTEWVVTVGGIALVAITILYGLIGRDRRSGRPSAAAVTGTVAMLIPIATAVVVSDSTLGSLAASKRLSARGVDIAALAELESGAAGKASFLALSAAEEDPELARRKGIQPGSRVRLVGFVSRAGQGPGAPFEISRFYITCCVADAIPIGVTVDPGLLVEPSPERDQWLQVTGTVARFGDRYGIRAEGIAQIAQPSHPYLAFTP